MLLIPAITTLIYVYSVNAKNKAVDVLYVTLYDSTGEQLVAEQGYAKDASLKSLVGIFYSIAQSKNLLAQPPTNPDEATFVRAKLTLNGVQSDWRCYFSLEDNSLGYCVDANGLVYKIDQTVNKNFLSLPYAEHFYTSATPPSLLTIDRDTVIPTTIDWYYKNNSEDFLATEFTPTTTQSHLYHMTGEFGFHFDTPPEECEVTIRQGDVLLFNGSYQDIPSFTTDPENNILQVSVQATWKKFTDSKSYGSAEYEFEAKIDTPALFNIHKNEVSPGDLLIISCANVFNLSKIQFSIPSIDNHPTPIFHQDGEFVRALFVIPETFEEGDLSFTRSIKRNM